YAPISRLNHDRRGVLDAPVKPGHDASATNGRSSVRKRPPMLSREERTPFSEWWWTVDKPLMGAILALMLCGVILSLAASPPVATRIGLDPFHFFSRHVMFLAPSGIVLLGADTRAEFINRAFRDYFALPDEIADSQPPFIAL
ncbi:hypothetical protein KXV85_005224, partial [Aspergillus fumigatus]